ncbi:hypothetical protein [Mesorhizobium sp. B2-3-4]|uniref:hypothetical protein n=1 Tax=Mesorhizobium sp. B2-3-4 TaxID=2589959 RepID=UPI00112E5FCD|nr:hypothetical protein [Mesorhizobium sp. B2-3-4]TPM38096.1 hypothetical protein FJ967_12525 [Mesorhizobium sp. B2-3-4]
MGMGTSQVFGDYRIARWRSPIEEDDVKALHSLIAELSSNWLRRRKALPPAPPVKTVSRPHQQVVIRPAHKPKPRSTRDVASNM